MTHSHAGMSWSADLDLLQSLETACYLFDPSTVVSTYSRLKTTLGTPLLVSFKANPNVDLFVRCSHAFTDGVELASQGELNLIAGRAAGPKYVNTPAMESPLIHAAAASRATLVLDNLHQVQLALAAHRDGASLQPVVLRANAASVLGDAGARVQADHFGMEPEALMLAASMLLEGGVGVKGLHVYAGSYTFEACGPQLCGKAIALLGAIEQQTGQRLNFLNLGGGFADDWNAEHPKFAEYRRALAAVPSHVTAVHEAGRAIFASGGVFVTRVLAVKTLGKRHVAICDGGLAHCFMLAQTEKVIKKPRRPRIVPLAGGDRVALDRPVQFVGNSCNRSDVIGEMAEGELPRPGDLAVFDGCGSYHTYTPKNFLELKAAKHYVVS